MLEPKNSFLVLVPSGDNPATPRTPFCKILNFSAKNNSSTDWARSFPLMGRKTRRAEEGFPAR